MATVNGALGAPSQDAAGASPQQTIKRKREESAERYTNGATEDQPKAAASTVESGKEATVADFITVLKRLDITPSILGHDLPARSTGDEPQTKRKKSDASEQDTISRRAEAGAYSSIDEIAADVDSLCATLITDLQRSIQEAPSHVGPEGEQLLKTKAFRKRVKELVETEKAYRNKVVDAPNGVIKDESQDVKSVVAGDHKLVLTLYGNAQGAKQLFSSFQDPTATQPLREIALPNGISTTQIIPPSATGLADEKRPSKTLGELFPAPTNTPSLQPPKPSKAGTTRSSAVGWYQPSGTEQSKSKSQTYFGQDISTGQWLNYSQSNEQADPKKKQRERAMSLSGVRPANLESDTAEQETAKLDALFRSAYSGFAPTKDDSAAIAPVGQLNRIWWQRSGGKSFQRLVESALGEETTTPQDDDVTMEEAIIKEEDDLAEPITDWEQVVDPNLEQAGPATKSIAEKDVDEVLEGISELLETLHSYQRNRNLSLNPQRAASALATSDTTTASSKPSESETATYNILKSQLALMVASLPPYAVAKLDSDQLEELAISTKIPILLEDHKGVMEEDEASARAKLAAMSAASSSRTTTSAAPLHRSSSSLYGNQYASPARTPMPNNYYSSAARTPVRPSPGPVARPPATAPAPYGPRASPQASYRPQPQGYGTPTYPHQQAPPRTTQTPYGQSNAHQYFQSAAPQPYTSTYSQPQYGGGQGMNTAALNAARYQQNQALYPQNHMGVAGGYGYGATQHKIGAYSQPNQGMAQGRPLGNPQQTMTPDRRYFQQSQMHNGTPQHVPKSSPSPMQGYVGAGGYHTVMTPAEQASMMERQRAQLAQQQGVQMQARAAAQAHVGAINGSPAPKAPGSEVPAGP